MDNATPFPFAVTVSRSSVFTSILAVQSFRLNVSVILNLKLSVYYLLVLAMEFLDLMSTCHLSLKVKIMYTHRSQWSLDLMSARALSLKLKITYVHRS